MTRRLLVLRLTGAVLFLVTVALAAVVVADRGTRAGVGSAAHQPVVGPVVCVLLVAVLVCVLVPRSALALAAGLVYGPLLGSVTMLVGLALSAVLGHRLGRWLGRDVLARSRFWRTVAQTVADRGTRGVALVRLLPVPPYGLASMLLGAGPVRARPYLLGSLLGAAPNAVGYAAAGGALVSAGWAAAFSAAAGVAGIGAGIVVTVLERRRLAAIPPPGHAPNAA